VAFAIIEQRSRESIDAEPGITVDAGDGARRCAPEDRRARADRVGPDVVQRAAAGARVVANVGGIEKALGERRTNSSMSLRVTEGDRSASPATAARIELTSCSAGAVLSRNPLAPARSAS